ncbi:orotidine-5'-phosphate decarboxylase [Phocicoccus pinnipedialis]|uniref:Orotidine 5'-phosphate decarboxylase n=2 Tax=Phocicoccus pinnipedialis TaxID=110845 RepID=A0A6V7RGV6_9BACL|nr:orotidine-5'-phosphate decarboxylase [Jeotgalicoccus pinnipedialis]CAD2076985.1 Orotidine 5'-phosphate decarboxylase [Jeotgalicoccus pinnipedialis]
MTKPIIALDFNTFDEVQKFLGQFDESLYVKVGMELYMLEGRNVIKEIRAMGHDLFLDLKLHDIPNTVARTMAGLGKLDVQMVNVHARGGSEMMRRANLAFKEHNPDGICIAVTELTSTNENMVKNELRSEISLEESVLNLAALTKQAGLDGVVSSPLESPLIHKKIGENFVTVTPGIRMSENRNDDQVRIVTPEHARELGSNYIVVGRPITQSHNPVEAYHHIKSLWEGHNE